jgi:hypothetical protein
MAVKTATTAIARPRPMAKAPVWAERKLAMVAEAFSIVSPTTPSGRVVSSPRRLGSQ